MSSARICGLIGAILNSCYVLFLCFIMLIMNVSGEYNAMLTMGVVMFLALVIMCLCWVAFARMDKVGEQLWRIFLLVIGILAMPCSFFINTPAGVLFILAFALKSKVQQTQKVVDELDF